MQTEEQKRRRYQELEASRIILPTVSSPGSIEERFRKPIEDPPKPPSRKRQKAALDLKSRCYAQNYRARRLGFTEELTVADLQYILDRDQCCLSCGSSINLTFDHIESLVRGGRHHRSNLQLLCMTCNTKKCASV